MKPGRCGTYPHDYKRNGTTTLFAAIEMAAGQLIGTCMSRHRHQEWNKFPDVIDQQTPANRDCISDHCCLFIVAFLFAPKRPRGYIPSVKVNF